MFNDNEYEYAFEFLSEELGRYPTHVEVTEFINNMPESEVVDDSEMFEADPFEVQP